MFFRKNAAPFVAPEEATFKQRVETFWQGFAAKADTIYQLIEQRNSAQLDPETTPLVDALSESLTWVYGPGKVAGNHSLSVSAEGVSLVRPLTDYWLLMAPQLPGWDFFPSRQPVRIDTIQIEIGGEKYSAKQFWITAEVDEEARRVKLVAWCPGFANLADGDRWQILFLWLDECLGEDGTAQRLGKIEIHDRALAHSFPLTELREYVEEAATRLGWSPAGKAALSTFRFSQPVGDFPRGDMLIGHSFRPALWQDYLESEGKMADPLAGTSAAYYFLRLPNSGLPQGREVDTRIDLQELFDAELPRTGDGIDLGGGISREWSYIDLLLYDGRRSMDRVMEILRTDGRVRQATLHAFAGTPEKILARL